MRRVTIQAPFTDGLVTDVPAHLLGPRMAASARNMILVDGVATRRRGIELGAANSLVLSPILGFTIVEFALSDRLATLVFTKDGAYSDAYVASGADEFRFLGSTTSTTNLVDYDALPRCVYNDEVIICDQAGERGIRRYAGAGWNDGSNDAFSYEYRQFSATNKQTVSMNTTAGSREFSYTLPGTNDGNIVALATLTDSQPGWFVKWINIPGPGFSAKVANVYSTTKGTLLNAVSGGTWGTLSGSPVRMTGTAYPAVSVYSAGSVTIDQSTSTVTGVGTEWANGDWGRVDVDGIPNLDREISSMLYIAGGQAYHRFVGTVLSDTSMTVGGVPADVTAPAQYHITRGLPFADACVHRGSLVGAGVKQFPNRVYIAPPGWDLESPPGSVPPLRMEIASFQNPDPNYFLLDFIDVPSTVDTDPVVAVLSSPGPLLVIKQDSLYGIYGDFPNFSQSLISAGAGCIDRRSAFSCAYGQFWAGAEGIFRYTPTSGPTDLTLGRINREWRGLLREMDTDSLFCCMGEANGKLIVAVGDATHEHVLVHDIESGAWDGYQDIPAFVACATSRGSQFNSVDEFHFAASVDPDETPPAGDARAMVFYRCGSMLAGSQEAKPTDYNAVRPPTMLALTGSALARHEGIDGLSRMVDAALSADVEGVDAMTTPGTSTFTTAALGAVTTGGVLGDDGTATTVLAAAIPEAAGKRRRGRVGRIGRLHQFRVEVSSALDTQALASFTRNGVTYYPYGVAIHQLTASFRDSRSRA